MKTTHFFLFLFFALTGFSQTEINKIDGNGLKQGFWSKNYPNGKVRYEGNFLNDKPVGEWKRYHENGMVQAQLKYSESNDTVSAELFNDKGKLIATGAFLNEQKVGLWRFYLGKKLLSEENYDKGIRHGMSRKFYNSGELLEESEWDKGLMHGKYRAFFKNGNPYLECMYKNNLREGVCVTYFDNGRMEIDGFYKLGLQQGEWTFYNSDGTKNYILKYLNGQVQNPEVMDSLQNLQNQEFEQNKGKIIDPEDYLNNPSEYLIKSR